MTAAKMAEADFIKLFEEVGPDELAKRQETPVRQVYARRANLEKKIGRQITGPNRNPTATRHNISHPHRVEFDVPNGIVLVGSDLHAWPGEQSTAFRAFLKFTKELKPRAVIMNGDVIDGATISRHPPIGWEKLPTLVEEIETAQALLHLIELAAPKDARLLWPLGNHDARFSTRIATVLPELARINGVRLQDHFGERWEPCWSAWLNSDVVIKHRARGGIHATHNNVVNAGKTMITGHLHSLKVTPFSDYNERPRFGVDTGCLADTSAPAFLYLEDNPTNWRSGFAVLTFRGGRLMWPELVHVLEPGKVEFRSEIVTV